jgi:holin-like protein
MPPFLAAVAQVLFCQLLGEALARASGLPLPGPVLGAVLLFTLIAWHGGPNEALRRFADGLLRHLSLLFVPAGVGLIQHLDRLAAEWLAVGVALVGSTILTLLVTAGVFTLVARWQDGRRGKIQS